MKRALTCPILVILLAASASAQQSGRRRSVVHPAEVTGDWKIEITTQGGITGGGSGGLIVSSNGALTITLGSSPMAKHCDYQLTAVELRSLDDVVRRARPSGWVECYSLADVNTHCCDLIRTTFTLSARSGRDVYTTSWLLFDSLPSDLREIFETLRGPASIDARYRPMCVTAP